METGNTARFAPGHFLRIGHMGAAAYAPPNSLASVMRALDLGVDGIEVDVRATADGVIVLAHDDTVSHASRGAARISALFGRDLRECTADGEPIATLQEVIDLIDRRALLNLDMKSDGFEAGLVEQVLRNGIVAQTMVSSLSGASLRRLRASNSQLFSVLSYPRGSRAIAQSRCLRPLVLAAFQYMMRTLPLRLPHMVERAGARGATLHHGVVCQAVVAALHATGMPVYVWTVDDVSLMRRLLDLGVDGITSNRPDLFQFLRLS